MYTTIKPCYILTQSLAKFSSNIWSKSSSIYSVRNSSFPEYDREFYLRPVSYSTSQTCPPCSFVLIDSTNILWCAYGSKAPLLAFSTNESHNWNKSSLPKWNNLQLISLTNNLLTIFSKNYSCSLRCELSSWYLSVSLPFLIVWWWRWFDQGLGNFLSLRGWKISLCAFTVSFFRD